MERSTHVDRRLHALSTTIEVGCIDGGLCLVVGTLATKSVKQRPPQRGLQVVVVRQRLARDGNTVDELQLRSKVGKLTVVVGVDGCTGQVAAEGCRQIRCGCLRGGISNADVDVALVRNA
jgi:hypothetical protein